ncbi:hypothetical protein PFTANZ_05938, partial [Plasmodium falciparum Tanzania (2000708)]
MEQRSQQHNEDSSDALETHNSRMPASLDEKPSGYENKCTCPPPPEACEIVQKIFHDKTGTHFNEACSLKYSHGKEKHTQWKCNSHISSKTSDKDNGSVCIPPRRQKMYTKPIETLNKMSPLDLRTAFIESAAVETFFSWHEYKVEKKKEKEEQAQLVVNTSEDDSDAEQKKLNGGEIPEDFLRQMFYTLGDYRDLCLGKDIDSDIKTVKTNINKVFTNSSKSASSKTITPNDWWETYGKDIWEGMLCSLSYDTKTQKKVQEEHDKLMGATKTIYKYNTVTFNGGFNENSTKLTNFVKRPPYFRWFEEWADEFCRKRTHKLEKIKVDCRGLNGQNNCDDDGFDCTQMVPNKHEIFKDFICQSCATSCKSYKQWISAKKKEFNKQQNIYDQEIQNIESNYDKIYDDKFLRQLSNDYISVDVFLKKLKDGPCCKNNIKYSRINFNNPDETFKHAEYCAPCPVFGVKHSRNGWSSNSQKTCDGIIYKDTRDIKNIKHSTEKLNMLVSHNSENRFPSNLNICEKVGIFEGIRNDEWTCVDLCKSDICVLEKFNNDIHDKQNILFRSLFKRWLENFLEDYNKINNKISHCMKNGGGDICINGCENKCECVDKWIKLKKKEWEKVRDRYFNQYKGGDTDLKFFVRSFLETLIPQTDVDNVIGKVKTLSDLEKSTGCTSSDTSENGQIKYDDVVECLFYKLQEKIDT